MNIKKCNARYLEEKLKKGWTCEDLLKDLNIEKEEFEKLLLKNFNSRAIKDFKRRMEANNKIAKKTRKTTEQETVEKMSDPPKKSELELLQSQELQIRDFLFKEESKIKEGHKAKKVCEETLKSSRERLKKFMVKLESERELIQSAFRQLGEIKLKIENSHSEVSRAQKELNDIRKKIEKLNVLTVIYQKDRKIVCNEMELPDNFETERFIDDLMRNELLEDLTIKEIRIMGNLLAVAEYLEVKTGRKIEFMFEEESNISIAIGMLMEEAVK